MVTVIFRMRIKDGKESEAVEALTKMAAAVEANEPGTAAYACHRMVDDPSQVVFFEVYADDAALQNHTQTPHMGEFRAAFGALFDPSTVEIERLERIGGYARAG